MYKGILSTAMLSGAACLFVSGVLALRDGDPAPYRMDNNGDRQVTWTEAVAAFPKLTREHFNARDANGDGVWTCDELLQRAPERKREVFPRTLDADNDGRVSFEEAQTADPKLTLEEFINRDITGDGVWTAEDYPAATQAMPNGPEPNLVPTHEG